MRYPTTLAPPLHFADFADGWCRFDFFLVSVSLMDQFFMELLLAILPMPPTVLRVLRVARVLRILRLLKNLKGLRDLVFTLVLAFPSLINVGCLLGIVMFMYAVLGLNLFTFVMHGGDVDADRNFESFGNSMLTLFQCLTGDGWSAIMDDLMVDELRGCDPTLVPSNCGTSLALPFFISWTVVGSFVFLNLIVAVILEHFTALGNVDPTLVSSADISDFKDIWGKFDPDADGKMPAKELPNLVKMLKPPLGLQGTETGDIRSKRMRWCMSLGLQQENGEVAFREVLDALINKNYAEKQVSVADEVATAPPESPLRSVLEMRRSSLANSSPQSLKPADSLADQPPLTPRRAAMARIFADELLRGFVRRKKVEWEQNPNTHPAVRGKQRRAQAAQEASPVSKAASQAAAAGSRGGGKAAQQQGQRKGNKELPPASALPPPRRAPKSDRVDA